MKIDCNWNGKQDFVTNINGFRIRMATSNPFGDQNAQTPKELVLAALCGDTGNDVVGLLKKNKQLPEKLTIEAEASVGADHPHELTDIKLKYKIDGHCEPSKVKEAVGLAQARYCVGRDVGSKTTNIAFDVSLNGKNLGLCF